MGVEILVEYWQGVKIVATWKLWVDSLSEASHWHRRYNGFFNESQYNDIIQRRKYVVHDEASFREARRRFYRYDMPRH